MKAYQCQPAFYIDRSDNWLVDAETPAKAAERFRSLHSFDQERLVAVRVMDGDVTSVWQVEAIHSVEYKARELEEKP